jgi:hypothetical protein
MDNNIVIEPSAQSTILTYLPQKTEDWIMWISSITLTILFFVAAYFGAKLSWYQQLKRTDINQWLLAGLWVIASLISYGTFYFVKDKNDKIYGQSRLLPYFLIISFLNVLWTIIYFYNMNFLVTLFIILLIIVGEIYIMLFLLNIINFWAVILMLPLIVLYVYLLYSILHTASINGIIL